VNIAQLLDTTAEWLTGGNSRQGVVISSRMRLARNVGGASFPTWAKKPEREKVYESIMPALLKLPEFQNPLLAEPMDKLTVLEKQILVEQHLISREHAAKAGGSGVAVSHDRSYSIMVNEEDHLRMQAFAPGLQLREVWSMLDAVDSGLESYLQFAFSPRYGYLTACPTNVGTGMRASAMLHVPALVLNEQINQIVQAVGKLGLAVRGLYGEGTEAMGNLFQVSNQQTLGESESEIIERLQKVIQQIAEHEQNARAVLLEKRPRYVADQVGRAHGALTSCYSISSKEALNLLSILRLGSDLDMLPRASRQVIDELMIVTQPGHLQSRCDQKLNADERDGMRADLIRDKLATINKPDTRQVLRIDTRPQDS